MTGPSSAPTTAGRPRSSTSRDATSPTIPTGHGPRTIVAPARVRRQRTVAVASPAVPSHRSRAEPARIARASAIVVFVRSRRLVLAVSSSAASAVGLLGRLAEQQAGRNKGLAHPARGVDPRSDRERKRLDVHVARRDAGRREERHDPGPRLAPDPLQPEADDRPRLAEDRDEVGDAPDRGEVREVERGVRAAGLVGQEELGDLERDAAAGEASLRVLAVGALRVDDRERDRQLGRDPVVVGDEDVDPGRARRSAISGRLVVPQSTVTMTVAPGRAARRRPRPRTARGLRRAGSGRTGSPRRRGAAGSGR